MNRCVVFFLFCGICALTHSRSLSQDEAQWNPGRFPDSSSSVATGVTVDGIKYFIKIVPRDSTLDEKMPVYQPGDSPIFVSLDQQPFPMKQVEATYPEVALRDRIEGTVWVLCLVGKDGRVQKTKVARADAEILIEPALAAAKQWVFSPGRLKGKPIPLWSTIPFRFKLDH